ncbi:MAG: hypothetical protein R6U98_26310 [Pirellulaceae bacterium]
MIKLDCPACGNPLKGPDEFAGKSARCPACRTSVAAPQQTAPAPVEHAAAPVEKDPAEDLLKEARSAAARQKPESGASRKPANEKPVDASPKKRRHLPTGTVIAFSVGIFIFLIAGIITAVYVSNVMRQRRIDYLIAQSELQLNTARRAYEEAQGHLERARDAMEQNQHDEAAVAYTRAQNSLETTRGRLAQIISSMEGQGIRFLRPGLPGCAGDGGARLLAVKAIGEQSQDKEQGTT